MRKFLRLMGVITLMCVFLYLSQAYGMAQRVDPDDAFKEADPNVEYKLADTQKLMYPVLSVRPSPGNSKNPVRFEYLVDGNVQTVDIMYVDPNLNVTGFGADPAFTIKALWWFIVNISRNRSKGGSWNDRRRRR